MVAQRLSAQKVAVLGLIPWPVAPWVSVLTAVSLYLPVPVWANEGDQKTTLEGDELNTITPESATLPERVFRARGVYVYAFSDQGFDGASEAVDTGLDVALHLSFLALEYGITDHLSAQVLVPWSFGGGTTVRDQQAFDNSVRKRVEQQVDLALSPLLQQIRALYDSNAQAPENITSPSGQVLIPAGTPVRDGFTNVRRAAIAQGLATARNVASESTLQTGLGDVEVGAKYALSTVARPFFAALPLYTSVALGLRLNSSGYDIARAGGEIPSGRGTNDLGLRLNADWQALPGLQVQVENQTEFMVVGGTSWDLPEVDGGKEVDYSREGLRQVGYTKLAIGPGAWWDPLALLLFSVRYVWDNDPPTKTGDVTSAVQIKRAAQAGISLNGLAYRLPIQLDYDYVHALPSPNLPSAFNSHQIQLKAYARF